MTAKPAKPRRATRPSGEMIRRVANAIREANTRDYFVMAEAALNALKATDLLWLLPDPPKQSPRPVADTPAA